MKKKILIVDDNKSLIEMLKEYFSSTETIEVAEIAYDGEDAWDKIQKTDYDCVLLDLVMPKRDGMYVLEKIKESKLKRNVIVITSYSEQETIRSVGEFGARYFIAKPFNLKDLEKRIMSIFTERESKIIDYKSNDLHASISKVLHELGIPSHIKGYQYIRDAIFMVYSNEGLIGGITKELYPELSKKYNASVTRIERAIRHAIEVSWNRGDWDLMEDIFGHSVDIDKAKPTNSEFIVTIADKMRLEEFKIS